MTAHRHDDRSLSLDEIDPFPNIPRQHFGAILADPPWRFATWNRATAIKRRASHGTNVSAATHYETMTTDDIAALPVADLAGENCCLFMWISWPMLPDALRLIEAWGFQYKTCAFDWMKAHAGQLDMLRDDADVLMGMGYWTRSNSEPCLLATRGAPKRISAAVRQGIIEPRREHSRKPDCVHDRIQQLVPGPYLELFGRAERPGWTVWGNEVGKFKSAGGALV
jgi:N6-adenosine-specific RNA methylase IME4